MTARYNVTASSSDLIIDKWRWPFCVYTRRITLSENLIDISTRETRLGKDKARQNEKEKIVCNRCLV